MVLVLLTFATLTAGQVIAVIAFPAIGRSIGLHDLGDVGPVEGSATFAR